MCSASRSRVVIGELLCAAYSCTVELQPRRKAGPCSTPPPSRAGICSREAESRGPTRHEAAGGDAAVVGQGLQRAGVAPSARQQGAARWRLAGRCEGRRRRSPPRQSTKCLRDPRLPEGGAAA